MKLFSYMVDFRLGLGLGLATPPAARVAATELNSFFNKFIHRNIRIIKNLNLLTFFYPILSQVTVHPMGLEVMEVNRKDSIHPAVLFPTQRQVQIVHPLRNPPRLKSRFY